MRCPLLCLLTFINTGWDNVEQRRDFRVPYLHSTNRDILSFSSFPWHHRHTSYPPTASPGRNLALHYSASLVWVDWNFFFSTNLPSGICSKEITLCVLFFIFFLCFRLSLPIVLIRDWIPKVQWSFNSVGGGKKWNQAKPVLWSWMSQGQFTQITWPFVPEATQLGNWVKTTISLQIKPNLWAELSWATEFQCLKQLIWAQDLIKIWIRWWN